MIARIPLILDPQPEGGYTVTSPLIPELVTEGDTVSEALANAEDAFAAVVEVYEDRGHRLPPEICLDAVDGPVSVESSRRRSVRYREAARKLSILGCREIVRRGGGSHRKWFNPPNTKARCNTGLGWT